MDLENVAYVFTITGGGWEIHHKLYVITKDQKVLFMDDEKIIFGDIRDIDNAELEYLFDLEETLDFETHTNRVGMDAPSCVMLKAVDGALKMLYNVGMYDNTPAVDTICRLHYALKHK